MKILRRQSTAFTLIEFLVVIATLGLLAVMIPTALARSSAQPKSAACAARFRQWAVSANLYAIDHQDLFPSGDASGGGSYARDVGTNLCNALYPYGMAVPDGFVPCDLMN